MPRALQLFGLWVCLALLVAVSARAQEASVLPEVYQLTPAYPNPFQTTTTFTLTVAQAQPVRIELFNLLGQRLRLLYDGWLPGGEPRSFHIEAGDLPSGVYLYRVQGTTFTVTRRVLLIR
ncbi:T9SS type A sorting domain-containing protein [Rhodothermus bifroesti]|nr:T9SS type A sorting domain-containing protein [Rhodothermus bifroesti]GBD02381.1 hypothetical protein HRbin18_02122 [bacterium HR18]